jgi:hypothetical protein
MKRQDLVRTADVLLGEHVRDRPLISHHAPFEIMPPEKGLSHRVYMMAMRYFWLPDLCRSNAVAAHYGHAI